MNLKHIQDHKKLQSHVLKIMKIIKKSVMQMYVHTIFHTRKQVRANSYFSQPKGMLQFCIKIKPL